MKFLFSLLFLLAAYGASAQTAPADTTLNEFKGSYKFPDGSMISTADILVEGKNLVITASLGSSPLPRINKDTFSLEAYNGVVIFRRSKEGKVSGIYIDAGGTILEGERVEIKQMAWIRQRNLTAR